MRDTFARKKKIVYTVYIQSAEIWQKSESVSKNKFEKNGEYLVVNGNESYKLFHVVRTIRKGRFKYRKLAR